MGRVFSRPRKHGEHGDPRPRTGASGSVRRATSAEAHAILSVRGDELVETPGFDELRLCLSTRSIEVWVKTKGDRGNFPSVLFSADGTHFVPVVVRVGNPMAGCVLR